MHSSISIVGCRQAKHIAFGFRISSQGHDSFGKDQRVEFSETNGQCEEKSFRDERKPDILEELMDLLRKAINNLEVARLNKFFS